MTKASATIPSRIFFFIAVRHRRGPPRLQRRVLCCSAADRCRSGAATRGDEQPLDAGGNVRGGRQIAERAHPCRERLAHALRRGRQASTRPCVPSMRTVNSTDTLPLASQPGASTNGCDSISCSDGRHRSRRRELTTCEQCQRSHCEATCVRHLCASSKSTGMRSSLNALLNCGVRVKPRDLRADMATISRTSPPSDCMR